jgi:hypothetical protein
VGAQTEIQGALEKENLLGKSRNMKRERPREGVSLREFHLRSYLLEPVHSHGRGKGSNWTSELYVG